MLFDKPLKMWPLLFHVRDKLLIDTAHLQFSRGDVGIRNHLMEGIGRVSGEVHERPLGDLLQRVLGGSGVPLLLRLLVNPDGSWTGGRRWLLGGQTGVLRLGLALLGAPLLGFLKERGDVDGIELVEELFVDSGHPNGNIIGRLLLTEGESELGSNKMPKIGTDLSHRCKRVKHEVWEDGTHPTGGTKVENLLVEGMKVNLFPTNVQCGLIDRKFLRRAEVSI